MLNQALHASFADASEQRYSDRRVLRLQARVATPDGEDGVQVHNLSHTGMLVECEVALPVGSSIEVELPGGKIHGAEVIWADGGLIGCRFDEPLSQATLSAALLRATPQSASAGPALDVEAMRAKLRETWSFENRHTEVESTKLGLSQRMWIILGLGALGWAVPAAAAWAFW